MAKIKQFVPRRETSVKENNYEEKLKSYRRSRTIKLVTILIVAAVVAISVYVVVSNAVYTSYTEVTSVSRSSSGSSTCMNYNGNLLMYSKDGISCTDTRGNMLWNETYQMQRPIIRINESAIAVGDYNGNTIYIMDENGKAGEIDTNLPIRDFSVSETGVVAVVLEDTKLTRLNLYDSSGNELVKSEIRMQQNGYPLSVALSETGTVMEVSYLYVDSGTLKSSVAFYNFSDVGQNSVDRLVSGNDYADTVVPYVGFLGKDAAFAVGDNRISFYSGEEKPVSVAECLLDEEIQEVYTDNENYVGLVYVDTTGVSRYRLDVYDKKGNLTLSKNIDFDYQNILIQKKYILIYSDTECVMYNLSGRKKYEGTFAKKVSLMIPTSRINRFVMVTSDSIDTIELK